MLRVTRGEWHKKIIIPWLQARTILRLVWLEILNFFPYRRKIGAVVTTMMDKDRQESARKK
jgi:hypothetical protein